MSAAVEVMNSILFEEELEKLEVRFYFFASQGGLTKTQVQEMRTLAKAARNATDTVKHHPQFANRVALLDKGFQILVSRFRNA